MSAFVFGIPPERLAEVGAAGIAGARAGTYLRMPGVPIGEWGAWLRQLAVLQSMAA